MADLYITQDRIATTFTTDPVEQFVISCRNGTTVVAEDGTETDSGQRPVCARVALTDAPDPVTPEFETEAAARLGRAVKVLRVEGCPLHGTVGIPDPTTPVAVALGGMSQSDIAGFTAAVVDAAEAPEPTPEPEPEPAPERPKPVLP